MSGSLGDRAADDEDDVWPADLVVPDDLREQTESYEGVGVVGYAPVVDYDEAGIRTVITRLTARGDCVEAVAADLRGRNVTDVYVVTGEHNLLAICRFADQGTFDAFITRLATDDRVLSVTATVTLDTVTEYDHLPLLVD